MAPSKLEEESIVVRTPNQDFYDCQVPGNSNLVATEEQIYEDPF